MHGTPRFRQPLNAVVCVIDSLPAGSYDLGLPREAYPNGQSRRRARSLHVTVR
jgi:hypothetical protein